MDTETIIRSWKEDGFRMTLAAHTTLPQNPAGEIKLADEELTGRELTPITTSPWCIPTPPLACKTFAAMDAKIR